MHRFVAIRHGKYMPLYRKHLRLYSPFSSSPSCSLCGLLSIPRTIVESLAMAGVPDTLYPGLLGAIVISSVFTCLSTLAVVCRFITARWLVVRKQGHYLGSDDWTCLASLIFGFGAFIGLVLAVTIGRGGRHITEYSAEQIELFLKVRNDGRSSADPDEKLTEPLYSCSSPSS